MRFVITEEEKKQILKLYEATGNPLTFSKVIEIPNKTKDEIYDDIKEWLAMNFKPTTLQIQLDDKTKGLIIFTGRIPYFYGRDNYDSKDGYLDYKTTISIKDNKFRVEITDFEHFPDERKRLNLVGTKKLNNFGMITDSPKYETQEMNIFGLDQKVWEDIKEKIADFCTKFFQNIQSDILNKKKDNFDFQP